MKTLAKNKKAFFDYEIVKKYEAGIVLKGAEVKSILNSHVSLNESFIRIEKAEAYLWNAHITNYKFSSIKLDEYRSRKLLLKKNQILELSKEVKLKSVTIVPLSMFLSDSGKIKVEIALVRGKKKYDKRESLKKKEMEKDVFQFTKQNYRL